MKTDTYNGWTNYETWNAALWLGNDEGSYRYCEELTQEAWKESRADQSFSRKEKAAFALAESLKRIFEEDEEIPSSGWIADAINTYLSEVNWYEIAKSYLDDADLEEEAEEEKA